jgi:hypothetical protein
VGTGLGAIFLNDIVVSTGAETTLVCDCNDCVALRVEALVLITFYVVPIVIEEETLGRKHWHLNHAQ